MTPTQLSPADQKIMDDYQLRKALQTTFSNFGMRLIDGSLTAILAKLGELGVTVGTSPEGFLTMSQAGTEIAPSGMATRIRKELPFFFLADPRFDSVSSIADLEKGTASEIRAAKAAWIAAHGADAYGALPKTKAEAEVKSAPVNADMTSSQWKGLPWKERSRLTGIFDEGTLRKIMVRKG